MPFRSLAVALVILVASPAAAQQPVDDAFFEAKVRPLLAQHCQNCHGKDKHKGELRLDTKAGFDKGGDAGPAKELILPAVRYDGDLKMPPKGKLPDADVAVLEAWVKGGAPWPADKGPAAGGTKDVFDIAARAKAHWSFQPVRRVGPPDVRNPKSEVRNPIDAFLLAKLVEKGLTFAPPADPRTLIRRATFDLTGLPPTPEEVEAFAADRDPLAYEKLVDRLLASPAYGERWGRHWLDLARYAETFGHEFDFELPDAWRYRDYVVRALNADVPYNQFLTELLAGDLLPRPRRNPTDRSNESLTATGFWWLGEAKHSPVDSRAEFADRVDNQIDAFGKAVLGLTLACARCHDHKFDPVSTKDYYALFGVLSSSRYHRADVSDQAQAVRLLDELKASGRHEPAGGVPDGAKNQPVDAWREKAVAFERFDAGWRDRWDAAGLAFRPEAGDSFPHSGRETAKLAGALRSPTFVIDKQYLAVRAAGEKGRARLVLNGLQLIQNPIYGGLAQEVNKSDSLHWVVFDLKMWKGQPAYLELLDDGPGFIAVTEAWFADAPPPAAPGRVPLPPTDDATKAMEAKLPPPVFSPTIRDAAGRNEKIAVRGNQKAPGAEAPRAFLEVFDKTPLPGPGSGRLELAKKVTDPTNPLVPRVLVNRLWKHHFGEGIVRSPDDFGYQGQPPTHPELLDWLAAEFVEGRWTLKRMHRLMLLSTAYRQASRATPEQAALAVTADPQNKLLHRQNVRRLEAEAIRDAILAVSGRLDRTVGGPGVLPHLTEHQVGRGRPASGPLDGNGRRSLYLAVRRNFLNPMFVAFDYPTPFTAIGRRTVSNVPAQALVMLNNPFVIQQADLWARRVLAEPGLSADARVARMYASAFGRAPSADERATARAFVAEVSRETGRPDDPKAWADLAHALFNAKEFIFLD
ncbi:PSD1 domain-containing protein [bacterium]|nr:PSD1 domain-containing protein [bacterium]